MLRRSFLPALLPLLWLGHASAAECTALTENTLTSSGCPSKCDDNPCVLYSPSQDECLELGASGPCYADSSFTLPGTTTECNVTYQCLDTLLWDGNQWLLALEANAATSSKTMAYVTEITDLTYSDSTLSVARFAAHYRNCTRKIKKEMLSRLVLIVATAASVAMLSSAEPLKDAPYTPTDSEDSIYTTLSHKSPMAGMANRRLEPFPTADPAEKESASIYTTLSHNGPMAGMANRRLEPLPTADPQEKASTSIYTTLSDDGPMAGMGPRNLRQ